jgi:hypothetical protein
LEILTDTQEFERMKVMVQVTPELGVGYGSIDTASITDQEAESRAEILRDYLTKVNPQAGCGCIDGRCLLHTMAGKEALPGPKLGGGHAITSLFALELDDYFRDNGTALEHFTRTAWLLERAANNGKGSPIRFHTDSDTFTVIQATLKDYEDELSNIQTLSEFIAAVEAADLSGKKTACGMNDSLESAFTNMSSLPKEIQIDGLRRLETSEEVDRRLGFIRSITEALADNFDEQTFKSHIARATKLTKAGHFKNWHSLQALLAAEKVLRDLNSDDSILDRIDVLQSTNQGVHGHIEWAVVGNKLPGLTLDSTHYTRDTGLQVFTVDIWKAYDTAPIFAVPGDQRQHTQNVAQGMIAAQPAGYVSLGAGKQRGIILT